MIALPFREAVIVPAVKLPEASRRTSVLGALAAVPVVRALSSVPDERLDALIFVSPQPLTPLSADAARGVLKPTRAASEKT